MGDADGDGRAELVAGAPEEGVGPNVGAGRAYLFSSAQPADAKLTSVSISCPPVGTVNAPFTCIVDTTLHNNGPTTPVGVGGAVNVGVPSDCAVAGYSMGGQGFGTLSLAASVSQTVSKEFQVTCSSSGPHQFVGCAIVQIRDAGVADPNAGNNFGSGQALVDLGGGSPVRTAGRCTTVDPPEVCGDGLDNDADTLVDEEPDTDADSLSDCVDADDDGDGFPDGREASMGTDALSACPLAVGLHAAWPPDFNDDRSVNVIDVGAVRPAFASLAGDGRYAARKDLTGDGRINIVDIGALRPFFGKSCG